MKLFVTRHQSLARVAFAGITISLTAACGGGGGADGVGAGGDGTTVPSDTTTGGQISAPGEGAAGSQETAQASPGGDPAAPGATNEGAPTPGTTNDPAAQGTANEPGEVAGDPAAAEPGVPADPAKPLFVPAECDADCRAHDIPGVVARAAKKYNLPRWFYFAIIRRESNFDRCRTQPEAAENKDWGRGLTQVTFPWFAGVPYPQHLSGADNGNKDWRGNMGLDKPFGPWVDMKDVTAIPAAPATESACRTAPKANDAYDPTTNLDRFSTGYAAPAYHLLHVTGENPAETLRKVAYHWHYGVWGSKSGGYPADPRPYLSGATGYDAHVKEYRAAVEKDDGVWAGPTCKPPYQATGC